MKQAKPYWEMTTDELAEATREFDREFPTGFGPPTARQRALLARAATRGRPVVGAGALKLHVSVERTLLARAEAYARKHKLNRSQVIALALRKLLEDDAKTEVRKRKSA
jgi:hypothetical protein